MRRFVGMILILGYMGGCGTTADPVSITDTLFDTTAETEVADIPAVEDILPEVLAIDVPGETFTFDSVEPEVGPLCEAGEGCFLDPCADNEDCLSGWCVEHMGEAVCTQSCVDECPPGWECRQIAGGVDIVYICVSRHANLCRPCSSGGDCDGAGGTEDVCVDYGLEGSFCGGACTADEDCPWGFSCLTTVTVDGVSTSQCVADAGVCPCTDTSVALGLWTPCQQSNEFGECEGKRVCAADGLLDCDAAIPAAEACNGIDDNCDGDIDEDTCDDDNACTEDQCDGDNGCLYTPLTEGECLDGDSCTIGDHCEEGICAGSPINCDDENPCTNDTCDGLGGCDFADNEADCDDGNPCTVADRCETGACGGTPVSCDCQVDGDCLELEDGDLCNGTLYCNTDKLPHLCELVPETVVECPAPEGADAFCLAASCDPLSGDCSIVPASEGFACDDKDPCTIGESCQEGTCSGGVAPNCNDGNPCTDDSCEPDSGCLSAPNAAPCSDGDVCTTDDQCDDGQCAGGEALACNDGNPCTNDSCDPDVGCVQVANVAQCDDGNACTIGEQCQDGQCTGSSMIDCDDDEICTLDSCAPEAGCTNAPLAGPCDDGNPCTGPDLCGEGKCMAGGALNCDDGNPCTADSCGDFGCVHTINDAGKCNDDNACTVGDHCSNGTCVTGGNINCDDDNPCTTDLCDSVTGCVYTFNNAPCNDDDACTLKDNCHLGECVGSGSLSCDDVNLCTDDSCDPSAGCEFVPNSADCDDGNPCTTSDVCQGGACKGSGAADCDDDNACTTDLCDAVTGCININNSDPCDNGNACTENDVCSAGVCTDGAAVVCDDGNICTDNECDPDLGCQYPLNLAPCDDGNICTEDDACANGECQAGPAISCDDGDKCTTNTCDPDSGCVYPAITPCCGNGVKEGGEACDDGNNNDNDGCKNNCTSQQFTNGMGGFYNTGSSNKETNSKLACESHWGSGNCCNDGCGSCNHRGYHKCGTPNCNGSTYWNYKSMSQSMDCGWHKASEILVSADGKNWTQ